jgi:uncharacterized SAM-binding protein YcdF (DUF218 family)
VAVATGFRGSGTMHAMTRHRLSPVSRIRRLVVRVLLGSLLIGLAVVGGTAFRVWQVGRVDDRMPADVIVVLGAAEYNGKPSAILTARLKHAKTLYTSGIAHYVVTVGGRKPGDRFTEAQAAADWLVDNGVPADHVVPVEQGSDTLESIKAAAAESKNRGWRTAVLVSDPWHSLRARTMAADFGLEAWTSPTHSGPIVRTRGTQINYVVRETAALLYYRLAHAPAPIGEFDVGVG